MRKFFLKYTILFTIAASLFSQFSHISSAYQYIKPSSFPSEIKKIQTLFGDLGLYEGSISGQYNDIKDDIITFQVDNGVIASKFQDGAGYIGPKTYSALQKKYSGEFTSSYSKIFSTSIINNEQAGTQKKFIVSAYYSPLRGQKKYATGSYAGDIRLNGNGTHGASGAPVHPGFIAAPKNYSFGTKIDLDGLGIGIVEDRGGAIVRAGVRGHEYDRLDIWMGYGDAGLHRALQWGKRTVEGKIVAESTKITIDFSYKDSNEKKSDNKNSLATKISPESSQNVIKGMQTLFSKEKLYSGSIDGKYKSFEPAIISFQLSNEIIQNRESYGAGYIGDATISVLEEKYPATFLNIRREDDEQKDEITIAKTNTSISQSIGTNGSNLVTTRTKQILKKYSITLTQKESIDRLKLKIDSLLSKKTGDDRLKIKSLKNKIRQRIAKAIVKTKNISLKNNLRYLSDILI